jgi:hypothetical protein
MLNAAAEVVDNDEELLDEEDESEGEDVEESDELADLPPELTPPKLPKSDSDDDESINDVLTRAPRLGWKPKIDHLPDAIVDGQLVVGKGDKILIQYPPVWMDSAVFIICEVDPINALVDKGYVRLWDPNKMQYACTSYIKGPAQGLVFKIPDPKKRWVPGEGEDMKSRRRRRRRRALVKDDSVETAPKAPPALDENGNPIKRKRGRPKGSKNKSTLEKEAQKKGE